MFDPNKIPVAKLILLSPVIALLVYVVFVRPVQVRLEQREFKKAEAFLEEKKNAIESLAGPADSVKKENSCGYSSAKFSKGSLACGSSFDYIYIVKNIDEANQKVDMVSKVGETIIYRLAGTANGFTEDDIRRDVTLEQDMSYIGFNCSLDYRLNKLGDNKYSLNIHTGCSKDAMTEMYPVRE